MVDKEQEQIRRFLKRTKDLQIGDEKNMLNSRLEGQLLKFTNVVKGYQYRWCVLDPILGVVEYYEKEEHKRSCKPRGTLNLTYASVFPSKDDSQSFVILTTNGDCLKLKATDAKERQFWVNQIRAVAERYTEQANNQPMLANLFKNSDQEFCSTGSVSRLSESNSLSQSTSFRSRSPLASTSNTSRPSSSTPARVDSSSESHSHAASNGRSEMVCSTADNPLNDMENFPICSPIGSLEPRTQLHELFHRLDTECQALAKAIDAATLQLPGMTAVYKTLLLSKATSQATISCLKQCMDILKRGEDRNQEAVESKSFTANVAASPSEETRLNDSRTALEYAAAAGTSIIRGSTDNSAHVSSTSSSGNGLFPSPISNMDLDSISLPDFPGDAEPDVPLPESELGSVENQGQMISHLISQLRREMDLTKIVLPTFILEKRSLLEMFADYLSHPDLFIDITRGKTPEARMLAFVQWYLTSFHIGKKDKVAKKPYNPVIGETFHCCWLVPRNPNELTEDQPESSRTETNDLITYCAEQVSHHPPVTAFHISLPARRMELNSSVHTKSKFHGLSISVSMLGKSVLVLGEHNGEEYYFTFPTAYAKSILTVPWFEFGGDASITCPQTGCSAVITFHTKPIRNNKLHQISAELFAAEDAASSSRELFAKVSGGWNKILEFEMVRPKESKKWTLDVNTLPVHAKRVRPIDKQRPEESRVLWQHVTKALLAGDLQLATEKKHELEERQRISEKYRVRQNISFPVKYFRYDGTSWIFRPPDSNLR